MMVTKEQRIAVLEVVAVIAEAIRELGEVPSSKLYARVMGTLDINAYNNVLEVLKGAKLIEVKSHLIRWIGPTLQAN